MTEPLDFISKLAALIPSPRVNLTRFHGVFAPNSQYRASIINRPKLNKNLAKEIEVKTESEKRRAMTWAARLKRAFNIDIKTCEDCSGKVKVIACIDEPVAINKILAHLQLEQNNEVILPGNRASPGALLFS